MTSYSRNSKKINTALLVSIILTILMAGVSIIFWLLNYLLISKLALLVALLCCILTIAGYFILKRNASSEEEKLPEKHLNKYLSAFFSRVPHQKKYRTPCLLAISRSNEQSRPLLESMGLKYMPSGASHIHLPVDCWHGSGCQLLHTGTSDNESGFEGSEWKAIIRQLRMKRPRQPLNGILLFLPVDTLVSEDQEEAFLNQSLQLCHLISQRIKQQLPVIVLVTGAGQVSCFYELCQTLHRDELSAPFGDIQPADNNEEPQNWFNQSWQKLLQTVFNRQVEALSQIHEPLQASNSLAASFQLALLGDRIKSVMARLHRSITGDYLKVSGYYVCLNTDNITEFDLSALYCEYHFATGHQPDACCINDSRTAFTRELVRRVFLPLANLAGLNKRADWFYQSCRYGSYMASAMLVLGTCFWLYANYTTEDQLSNQSTSTLNHYHIATSHTAKEKEPGIFSTIENLNSLQQLLAEYHRVSPALILSRWSHSPYKQSLFIFYQEQLRLRLGPYLIEALAESLKVQIKKENAHGIFESLRHYQMLFDASELREDELYKSLMQLLDQKYALSSASEEKLSSLLSDYVAIGDYAAYMPDMNLITEARGHLQGLTDSHLVYRRIKVLPEFHSAMPLEKMMGTHFERVFVIDEATSKDCKTGHYALFTSNGWKTDLSPESNLITSSLQDIRRLQGIYKPVSSKTAVCVSDAIRQRFTQEYISRWNGILSCINLRPCSNIEQLEETISYLAQWGKSPLTDILDTLKANTYFPEPLDQEDSDPANTGSNDLLTSNVKTGGIHRHDVALTEAFSAYHQLLDESEGVNFSKKFQQHLEDIYHNLHQLKTSDQKGLFAFRQIQQLINDRHPVKSIQLLALGQPDAIRRWLQQLVSEWVKIHGRLTENYLQELWQAEILKPYHRYLEARYPLEITAQKQVNPNDFEEFFRRGGQLDSFQTNHLSALLGSGGPVQLAGQPGLKFNPDFMDAIRKAKVIQAACFDSNGELSIEMLVRIQSLNTEATHFMLSDGFNTIAYNHGPSLWQQVKWPVDDDNQALTSSFYRGSQQMGQATYNGPWAWLQMINQSQRTAGVIENVLQIRHSQKDQFVLIDLKGRSRNQDMVKVLNALRDFSLPSSIIR